MNSKKKIYTAVIIGAGKIASGFDTPRSRKVLTHAHAIAKNDRVTLGGISDIDHAKGMSEAKKWKTTFFSDVADMLAVTTPDIIIIATPDRTHVDFLRRALAAKPGIILCEKPISTDKRDIRTVRALAAQTDIPVLVNFRRRFDVTVVAMRDALVRGDYGRVLSAHALYTKGILHNGSHMIDLLRYLFGEVTRAQMSFSVDDFPSGAPTLGGVMTFERCTQLSLMNGDERQFYLFELDIITERQRIRFVDEGRTLWTQDVIDDTVFKGDRMLGKIKSKQTGLSDSMSVLIAHAVAVLDKTEEPRSSLAEALRTEETCFQLLASLKKK